MPWTKTGRTAVTMFPPEASQLPDPLQHQQEQVAKNLKHDTNRYPLQMVTHTSMNLDWPYTLPIEIFHYGSPWTTGL